MKFGGTSVGSPDGLRRVIELIGRASQTSVPVVVVSAAAGVTDKLHQMVCSARTSLRDEVDSVGRTYGRLASAVLSGFAADEFAAALVKALNEIAVLAAAPGQSDSVVAELVTSGERLSARLLASALTQRGQPADPVDARRLIRTCESPDGATVETSSTYTNIRSWYASHDPDVIPVVTGYAASDAELRTTTLGRGGSDYTATLLAAALDASIVERWTDVDGIYTDDPRHNGRATRLPVLSLRAAAGEARLGRTGIHPEALVPLLETGIPMRVRSTRASGGGTLLQP
jgi:aspartate kinase